MNQPETPGPALYGTLLERAIEPSMKGVEATLKEDGEWFARQIKKDVDAALRRVYAEGVRHGFQQGVEAESKRRGD